MAATTAGTVRRRVQGIARPVAGLLLRPPMLPARYQPSSWLTDLGRRGDRRRDELKRQLSALLDVVVPTVLAVLLRRIDLTDTVQRYVDLDSIVAKVDLDAAAARLDVEEILGRLDLTMIVRERVDLDSLVAGVDLDKAAARLDLDQVVARLDLDAVVARLDLDALIGRIDLAGLAEGVIAEVDLAEIIRESTGSVASDTVRGLRMQGISSDEAVGRAVGRFRLRRSRNVAAAPTVDGSAPMGSDVIAPQPEAGTTTRES